MPLRIKLPPGDKLMINGAVIENGGGEAAMMVIHNRADILRRKEIMQQDEATSPAKLIYYSIQCAYMFRDDRERFIKIAVDYLRQYLLAAPSSSEIIAEIDRHIRDGEFYRAMQKCSDLFGHEGEILET